MYIYKHVHMYIIICVFDSSMILTCPQKYTHTHTHTPRSCLHNLMGSTQSFCKHSVTLEILLYHKISAASVGQFQDRTFSTSVYQNEVELDRYSKFKSQHAGMACVNVTTKRWWAHHEAVVGTPQPLSLLYAAVFPTAPQLYLYSVASIAQLVRA